MSSRSSTIYTLRTVRKVFIIKIWNKLPRLVTVFSIFSWARIFMQQIYSYKKSLIIKVQTLGDVRSKNYGSFIQRLVIKLYFKWLNFHMLMNKYDDKKYNHLPVLIQGKWYSQIIIQIIILSTNLNQSSEFLVYTHICQSACPK